MSNFADIFEAVLIAERSHRRTGTTEAIVNAAFVCDATVVFHDHAVADRMARQHPGLKVASIGVLADRVRGSSGRFLFDHHAILTVMRDAQTEIRRLEDAFAASEVALRKSREDLSYTAAERDRAIARAEHAESLLRDLAAPNGDAP